MCGTASGETADVGAHRCAARACPRQTPRQTASWCPAPIERHVTGDHVAHQVEAVLVPWDGERVGVASWNRSHASSKGASDRSERGSVGMAHPHRRAMALRVYRHSAIVRDVWTATPALSIAARSPQGAASVATVSSSVGRPGPPGAQARLARCRLVSGRPDSGAGHPPLNPARPRSLMLHSASAAGCSDAGQAQRCVAHVGERSRCECLDDASA